ncbi:MAG: hypothetical protein IIA92_13685 [Chloroflexi bacterium]|nr:hypothetical protein [Chloroflexota bacterium]
MFDRLFQRLLPGLYIRYLKWQLERVARVSPFDRLIERLSPDLYIRYLNWRIESGRRSRAKWRKRVDLENQALDLEIGQLRQEIRDRGGDPDAPEF